MEGSYLEIKDYKIFQFKVFLVFTTPIILFANIVLAFFFASEIPSFALFLFIPVYFLYGLIIFVFFKFKNRFLKFSLSRDKISLAFQKKLFFETDLYLIQEINITKRSVERTPTPYGGTKIYEGYSIRFKFRDSEKEIRLWCFGFKMRQQNKIIKALISLGEELFKSVKLIDASSVTIRHKEDPCREIYDFLKKPKYFQ